MRKGVLYALSAYVTWGLFPVYWKFLKEVPALQLLGHRILWSFLFLFIFTLAARKFKSFRAQIASKRVLLIYLAAAVLIGINWCIYVWAVNAGYIVETSLGYFINPLFSVLLGVIILKERLRKFQWIPIVFATSGVTLLSIAYGRLPWIALCLAFTFAIYGLIKKIAPLSAVNGLLLETGILFLPALFFLLATQFSGQGAFLHLDTGSDLLMIGAGLVTTIPLFFFASAAQRIPLSLLGTIQYIAPTLQFLLGVFAFREPFNQTQLIGFCIVWFALVLFWGESLRFHRKKT